MTNKEKTILNNSISSIEDKLIRLYRHYRLNDALLYGEKLTELDLLNMTAEMLLDIDRLKHLVNNNDL